MPTALPISQPPLSWISYPLAKLALKRRFPQIVLDIAKRARTSLQKDYPNLQIQITTEENTKQGLPCQHLTLRNLDEPKWELSSEVSLHCDPTKRTFSISNPTLGDMTLPNEKPMTCIHHRYETLSFTKYPELVIKHYADNLVQSCLSHITSLSPLSDLRDYLHIKGYKCSAISDGNLTVLAPSELWGRPSDRETRTSNHNIRWKNKAGKFVYVSEGLYHMKYNAEEEGFWVALPSSQEISTFIQARNAKLSPTIKTQCMNSEIELA